MHNPIDAGYRRQVAIRCDVLLQHRQCPAAARPILHSIQGLAVDGSQAAIDAADRTLFEVWPECMAVWNRQVSA